MKKNNKTTLKHTNILTLLCVVICLGNAAESPADPPSDGWVGQNTLWYLHQPTELSKLSVDVLIPIEIKESELSLIVDGNVLMKRKLNPGRHELNQLINNSIGPHSITLNLTGTTELPSPDGRTVCGQVNSIKYEPLQPIPSSWDTSFDIFSPRNNLKLGNGWNQLEHWNGSTFRWISLKGDILLSEKTNKTDGNSFNTLTIDAQPGPGCAGKPAKVRLCDNAGNTIDEVEFASRISADFLIPIKSLQNQPLSLIIENGGNISPGDTRALDLQVFNITWTP